MKLSSIRAAAATVAMLALSACTTLPGQPTPNSIPIQPNDVTNFQALYTQNCQGCHGINGKGGATIGLATPNYAVFAGAEQIRKITANGVPGTAMAAFAQSAGGMLTDKQVDAIVKGIRTNWGKPGVPGAANAPSYAAKAGGDVSRGALAYKNYCASCHGPDGRGGAKGSSITDNSFLALVSNQGLRTVVIAGRPELGAPDWRGNIPGKPMSEQEIGDVVAWLESQRARNPGQPYPVSNPVSNSAQR